jgi:hypothetical protein
MMHLAAWEQSVQIVNVLQPINAVQDPVITTSGADVRVPNGLANVIGLAALINDATAVRAQLTSPSLRATMPVDLEPIIVGKVFGSLPEALIHGDSPIPVMADESLNFQCQSNAAAPVLHTGLVWMSDGAVQPAKGPIFTVRATAACALTAATWINGNLTFGTVLPAGSYQVVGMRARGANLRAARLVFIGGTFRPGVAAVNALGNVDPWYFRSGGMGVFGQFDNTTPPTVDCLGDTDTTQVFEFDLIKVK